MKWIHHIQTKEQSCRSQLFARLGLVVVLMMQSVLLSGCTAALWKKDTFAYYHRPADPANLQLFYSPARKDILVRYDESTEKTGAISARCYWLETNTERINLGYKPHFSSLKLTEGLEAIPISKMAPGSPVPSKASFAVAMQEDDDSFTLYHGGEQLESYKLPTYVEPSRRVKQILLTPLALAGDATVIGAVIGLYCAPDLLDSIH
jgi:hypothetical protein